MEIKKCDKIKILIVSQNSKIGLQILTSLLEMKQLVNESISSLAENQKLF